MGVREPEPQEELSLIEWKIKEELQPVSKLGLTRKEITVALHNLTENNRIEHLAWLCSKEFTLEKSYRSFNERIFSHHDKRYLSETFEDHFSRFPDEPRHIPVFAFEKNHFAYAGSLSAMFDVQARENIINGIYRQYSSVFNFKGCSKKLDYLITGTRESGLDKILLSKLIMESLKESFDTDIYSA